MKTLIRFMLDTKVPIDAQGTVVDLMSRAKGEMLSMDIVGDQSCVLRYKVSTRGLIGMRNKVLCAHSHSDKVIFTILTVLMELNSVERMLSNSRMTFRFCLPPEARES